MMMGWQTKRSSNKKKHHSYSKRLVVLSLLVLFVVKTNLTVPISKQASLAWHVVLGSNTAIPLEEELQQQRETGEQQKRGGPLSRIILMGQFNYGLLPVESIVTWVDSMKRAQFADVIVRGDFLNQTVTDELRTQHGVNVILNRHPETGEEVGYFSPYLNLRDTLLEYHNKQTKNKEIDGVLYMHDDALPNLTMLSDIFSETEGKSFVGTDLGKKGLQQNHSDVSYMNPRTFLSPTGRGDGSTNERDRLMSLMAYRMYPHRSNTTGGQFADLIGNRTYDTFRALDADLYQWVNRAIPACQGGQWEMARDPLTAKYLEHEKAKKADEVGQGESYLQLPPFAQADFLYVPIDHAEQFAELATLTAEHRIWLECAIPMIVDQIMRLVPQQQVSVVKLCTAHAHWSRGKPAMIRKCQKQRIDIGVYHPLKLGHNATLWKYYFEKFNGVYLRGGAGAVDTETDNIL